MKIDLHALPDESTGLTLHLVLPADTDPSPLAWLGRSVPTGVKLDLSSHSPAPGFDYASIRRVVFESGFAVLGSG